MDGDAGYKYPLLFIKEVRLRKVFLLILLCSGCAVGRVSATPCMAEGLAIGRARLHATCSVGKSLENPIVEMKEPGVAMPIAECRGNYDYFHRCIDDEEAPSKESEIKKNIAKIDEGYVEISGGSPSTGFWSSVMDFVMAAGTLAATYFKFGL